MLLHSSGPSNAAAIANAPNPCFIALPSASLDDDQVQTQYPAMTGPPSNAKLLDGPREVMLRVRTGADVLVEANCEALNGRRVALITNQTGLVDGEHLADRLHRAGNVTLTAILGPEHGFRGTVEAGLAVQDGIDQKTGVRIHSLYGKTRKPTRKMLAGSDVLVFDIQDIGARFYTYISTMGNAMQAAASEGKRFVVLDRPNPINGRDVAGPMLDEGKESFVGFHSLPVRHGMTIGELAKMFQTELELDLKLDVIRCEGWDRNTLWDATHLMWVNPSPNMRNLTQALLYPGIGLLETTNLSVGRGTDTPFEIIGAPWIDCRRLAASLNAEKHRGVTFIPIEFTPSSSKFSGELCQGINVVITDRSAFEPLEVGFAVARQLRTLFPEEWQTDNYNRLLCNDEVLGLVNSQSTLKTVIDASHNGVNSFLRRRSKFLLY